MFLCFFCDLWYVIFMYEWQPSTLSELLEGLTVNDEVNRALEAWNSVCLWRTELIGEPQDEIEAWMLENDIESKRVRGPWADPARQAAAERVELAYFIVQALDHEYEIVRRIVAGWDPGASEGLCHTLDEYIDKLRVFEAQIHRQVDVVCAKARIASEQMDAQLEEALSV